MTTRSTSALVALIGLAVKAMLSAGTAMVAQLPPPPKADRSKLAAAEKKRAKRRARNLKGRP